MLGQSNDVKEWSIFAASSAAVASMFGWLRAMVSQRVADLERTEAELRAAIAERDEEIDRLSLKVLELKLRLEASGGLPKREDSQD